MQTASFSELFYTNNSQNQLIPTCFLETNESKKDYLHTKMFKNLQNDSEIVDLLIDSSFVVDMIRGFQGVL